ncbi:aromatic ring-hydroxylating dioxygenase subunit alpha [Streptomyces sp. WM6386]|uniref:aromatic ring-hydroxylating dioxygenase subunit alpha n=1 Tax=Streptomyces sp. WM6386 TaxID=1415558 RepID=UPI00061DF4AE|nr:aromatic ring-hydroxylating dioxygenase subunit alpha [Streptomyces sp. WM6386]KKD06643.1 hypothetical protein TN53_17710 [Streptomyces sp. WM6386]
MTTTDLSTTASADSESVDNRKNRSASITAGFRPGSFALRDAWFPVLQTVFIGRRPSLRVIHGRPIYLARENGVLVATEDSPRDRDRGRLRASEFTAGTGRYPVVERYGYAWVWYGDPANASPDLVPRVPHLPEAGGLPRHFHQNVIFDCSYELICENLLDLTHADFLHSWLTGDPLSEHDEITVESTSETVTMTRTAVGRPTPKIQRGLAKSDTQDACLVTMVHVRSGVCLLHGDFNPGMSVRMLHPANPETPGRTRTPVTYNVQHTTKLARTVFPFSTHIVGGQDNWAVRPQNPLYLDRSTDEKDMNSRFDAAGLRFRKVHQELVDRQRRGDYSYLADGDPGRDVTEQMRLERPR